MQWEEMFRNVYDNFRRNRVRKKYLWKEYRLSNWVTNMKEAHSGELYFKISHWVIANKQKPARKHHAWCLKLLNKHSDINLTNAEARFH